MSGSKNTISVLNITGQVGFGLVAWEREFF